MIPVTTTTTEENMDKAIAQKIANATGETLFRQEHYDGARWNAHRNLAGRSHYCAPETLRYFHSRILSSREIHSGAFFLITESVATDPRNSERGVRCVVFDLFGSTVFRPDFENCWRTRAQAQRAFNQWYAQFDAIGYYRDALNARAASLETKAAALKTAAAELVSDWLAQQAA
jgi:hypothetical protein